MDVGPRSGRAGRPDVGARVSWAISNSLGMIGGPAAAPWLIAPLLSPGSRPRRRSDPADWPLQGSSPSGRRSGLGSRCLIPPLRPGKRGADRATITPGSDRGSKRRTRTSGVGHGRAESAAIERVWGKAALLVDAGRRTGPHPRGINRGRPWSCNRSPGGPSRPPGGDRPGARSARPSPCRPHRRRS